MPLMFVHLSDIHFGQERGGRVFVHGDVRDRLVDDVSIVLEELKQPAVTGIIVTGDTAYSGKTDEYRDAGQWLDRVARAAGCAITKIQVVPGNHDVHRPDICKASEWMLERIAAEGEVTLDAFLEHEQDREV